MELSASNIEKESKVSLAKCKKLHQRHHFLEAERDSLKVSIEELNKEKGSIENKVAGLEMQRFTAKGKARL